MPLNFTRDLTILERIVCSICIYSKKYNKKKENFKKSGYLVEKPYDYHPDKYGSTRTHGFRDIKVYYKYGVTFYLEEDGKYSVSTFI